MSNSHHGGTETRRKSKKWVQTAWKFFYAVLREVFDEAAYERFLRGTHASHSRESYRAFMRERESGTAQKPRCC